MSRLRSQVTISMTKWEKNIHDRGDIIKFQFQKIKITFLLNPIKFSSRWLHKKELRSLQSLWCSSHRRVQCGGLAEREREREHRNDLWRFYYLNRFIVVVVSTWWMSMSLVIVVVISLCFNLPQKILTSLAQKRLKRKKKFNGQCIENSKWSDNVLSKHDLTIWYFFIYTTWKINCKHDVRRKSTTNLHEHVFWGGYCSSS